MSEVRGSGQECQAAMAQEQRRGATPRPRSGAAAESARLRRRRSGLRGATPCPRSGVAARRSSPPPEARGGCREEQPHIQGAVAVWAQEGLEELFHVQGQEGRW